MNRKAKINAFSIKEPQNIKVYLLKEQFKNKEEINKFMWIEGGVIYDNEFFTILESRSDKLQYKDTININDKKIKDIELKVPSFVSKLLKYGIENFFKKDKKFHNCLVEKIKELKKVRSSIESYKWNIKLLSDVVYDQGKYWLILNFKFRFTSNQNIWDLVRRDKNALKKYIGREFRFDFNDGYVYKIEDFIEDGNKAYEIKKYLLEKYITKKI